MSWYDDYEFPVPKTFFDDFSTRSPFVSKTWMALKGMKGHVLNIAPLESEIETNPKLIPPFLSEMNTKQRVRPGIRLMIPETNVTANLKNSISCREMSETSTSTNGSSRITSGALTAWMRRSVAFFAFWMRRVWRRTHFCFTVRIRAFLRESTDGLRNDGCTRKASSLRFSFAGPRSSSLSVIDDLVQNIDLAPTFIRLRAWMFPNLSTDAHCNPSFPKPVRRNGGKRFFINTLTEETSKNRVPTTCPGTKASETAGTS